MAGHGHSQPRLDVVEKYQHIDNLSEWCDRLLFAIHRGRYSHLTDSEFWPVFAASVRQWADEQADWRPRMLRARGVRPWRLTKWGRPAHHDHRKGAA